MNKFKGVFSRQRVRGSRKFTETLVYTTYAESALEVKQEVEQMLPGSEISKLSRFDEIEVDMLASVILPTTKETSDDFLMSPPEESPTVHKRRGGKPKSGLYVTPEYLTVHGERMKTCEWAKDERCQITYRGLQSRLINGWSHAEAVLTPSKKPRVKLSDRILLKG